LLLFLFVITLIVFKPFKLFFVLNLVCYIVITFSFTHSHSIFFYIWGWFYIRVVFFFLSAESLVD
jgi:hypothetical protein